MTTTGTRKREYGRAALTEPRQTRSQEGLTRMLQAGRDLIETSGNLDDLSISDIVERAGTSIGAFYRRFDNKDMFFEVVQDMVMTESLSYVHELIERDPAWGSNDACVLADAVASLYVRAFRRNRGLYHASLVRSSQLKTSWDPVKETSNEVLKLIVPRLVNALFEQRARKVKPAVLEFEVRAALQLIIGLLVNSVLNDPGPLSLTSRRLGPYLQTQFRRCLSLSD
ncbi:TetR/AcrR family transcriptional regulator [Paraburkholderia ginsengiterrae]|nr:TetR/AcrR family transcriptional regulator [Paraburkholderia ginsengiterrae]